MMKTKSLKNTIKPVLLAILSAYATQHVAIAQDDQLIELDKVEVISITPLKGLGVPLEQVPSAVQTVKAKDLEQSQVLDISSYMNQRMSGVYVNETQNNPLQPDINYRGFTASPLLGTPQGLSVYMDGVRLNQPFGDVVSWDLIPRIAIQGMQIMSGSNPLFGLNTLGGALSIQTKDGRTAPGGTIQTSFGSYGRKLGEFEYGGAKDDVDYYVAGSFFDENGWRDHSDSDYQQVFSKLGWRGEKTDAHLTFAYANSDLNGNGLAPRSVLNQNYNDVFTKPDNTKNESFFTNLDWSHFFSDNVKLTGNTYYRRIKTRTYNADINDTSLPDAAGVGGETVMPTAANANVTPFFDPVINAGRCLGEITSAIGTATGGGEPGEKCTGMINRTNLEQWNAGLFGQVFVTNQLFNKPNQFIVGGGFDYSDIKFRQTAEYGTLQFDRSVVGTGFFADQVTAGNINQSVDDRSVKLNGNTKTWSLFGTDTVTLVDNLNVSLSARYNNVEVENKDKQTHFLFINTTKSDGISTNNNLNLSNTRIDDDSDLSGTHRFQRLNPAIGLTYTNNHTNYYAGYNEGSRAPTSVELGCANPDNGCRLPNAMAGDPPLDQVVTRTWEAGVRVKESDKTRWSLGVFAANNYDDIMFLASTATGEGYFKNFGQTRRAGLEAAFSSELTDNFSVGVNYTYLNATYRSSEIINSVANSTAITRTATTRSEDNTFETFRSITTKSGDRIPGVPDHIIKMFANLRLNDKWSMGLDSLTVSDSYLRGNENNDHSSTALYTGDGKSPGYTICNLTGAFNPTSDWTVFAKVNNLFDKEYYTGGMLGLNPLTASGSLAITNRDGNGVAGTGRRTFAYGDEFLSPGAPRTAWIGVRYTFNNKKLIANLDKD